MSTVLVPVELKARWCFECGMDLFLSNNPLVFSERLAICDICRFRNRVIRDVDIPKLEAIEYRPFEGKQTADQVWNRFRRRIKLLKADPAEYAGFGGKLKRASKAIKNRDPVALIEAITKALDAKPCSDWNRRLMLCLKEAEFLSSTRTGVAQ